MSDWQPDLLEGFERRALPLPDAETFPGEPERSLQAVLVRSARRPATGRAVLYLHGWNDYFFQRHLADYWHERGYDFHALELRRYGRAWSPGQLHGFTTDLREYDAELDLAYELLASDHDEIVLTGHSTGGLVAALYADRRPGAFRALVLNSPWLDLQGTALVRTLSAPLVSALGGQRPTAPLPLPETGFNKRALHVSEGGEWDYDLRLKSSPAAPVRAGWMKAILHGHARVAAGLAVDCPVLVLCAARSNFTRQWSEELRTADFVLDVARTAARAPLLGPLVTIVRIPDGLHDLVLSGPVARARVFDETTRWLQAYA